MCFAHLRRDKHAHAKKCNNAGASPRLARLPARRERNDVPIGGFTTDPPLPSVRLCNIICDAEVCACVCAFVRGCVCFCVVCTERKKEEKKTRKEEEKDEKEEEEEK